MVSSLLDQSWDDYVSGVTSTADWAAPGYEKAVKGGSADQFLKSLYEGGRDLATEQIEYVAPAGMGASYPLYKSGEALTEKLLTPAAKAARPLISGAWNPASLLKANPWTGALSAIAATLDPTEAGADSDVITKRDAASLLFPVIQEEYVDRASYYGPTRALEEQMGEDFWDRLNKWYPDDQ